MTQVCNIYDIEGNPVTSSTSSRTSSSTSTTTTTTVHTDPGVSSKQRILEAYRACIGDQMTAAIAHYLELVLASGMSPDVIVHAIQETGWAKRPTAYYMRAILERYRRSGIMNMSQLLHDEAEWDARQREEPWWMKKVDDDLPY